MLWPCLLLVFGLALSARAGFFPDVPDGTRLSRDVTDAAYHQLMEGYPDGAFRAEWPLTRAGAVMVYARLLSVALEGFMVLPAEPVALPAYADVPDAHWMRAAAAYLAERGMLPPSGTRFEPARPVARGEFLRGLYRLMHEGALDDAAIAWLDERCLLPAGWGEALNAPITRGEAARVLVTVLFYLTQHAVTAGTITSVGAEADGLRWVELDTRIGPCRLAAPVRGVIIEGADDLREGQTIRTISDAVSGGGEKYYRVRKVTVLPDEAG
ncbi:MAG TPA: S-layer homology domain-containing protein [Armatimonadota bacterium]|nr:S-layer homology domain-containing protein [Armatimonadota bacterium]